MEDESKTISSKQCREMWLALESQFRALQTKDSNGIQADWDGFHWTLCNNPESHKPFTDAAERAAYEAGCGDTWQDWLSLLKRVEYGYVPIRTPADIFYSGKPDISSEKELQSFRERIKADRSIIAEKLRKIAETIYKKDLPSEEMREKFVAQYMNEHYPEREIEVADASIVSDVPERGEIIRVCKWSAIYCHKMAISVEQLDNERRPYQPVIPELEAMKSLSWNDVYFFYSKDVLRIKTGDFDKRFHFASLGFQDGRGGASHNSEWIILGVLALNGGIIPRKNNLPKEISKNLPTWITKLRKRLRSILGIEANPILYKDLRYQAQFHIIKSTAIDKLRGEEVNEITEVFTSDASTYTKHHRNPIFLPDKDRNEYS